MFLEEQRALVLAIDYQERILRAMAQAEAVGAAGLKLCRGAQILGLPLYYTEQYPEGLGRSQEDFLTLYEEGKAQGYAKTCFSALEVEALQEELGRLKDGGRDQVILAGIEAHICLRQTALALLEQGFAVYVAADACSSRKLENRDWAYQELRHRGAHICSVESLLYELAGGAKHPQFKALAKLIK